MSERTKENIKSIVTVILAFLVFFLLVTRCEKSKEDTMQKHHDEGYQIGYEDGFQDGSDAAQSSAYMEFYNNGMDYGAVDWCCEVILGRYNGDTSYTDDELDEAMDMLGWVYEHGPRIIKELEENQIEVEMP